MSSFCHLRLAAIAVLQRVLADMELAGMAVDSAALKQLDSEAKEKQKEVGVAGASCAAGA